MARSLFAGALTMALVRCASATSSRASMSEFSEPGLWGRHGTWELLPFEESSVPAAPYPSLAALSGAKADNNASETTCGESGGHVTSQLDDPATKHLRPVFFEFGKGTDASKTLRPIAVALGEDVNERAQGVKELRPVSFTLGGDFGARKIARL